MDDSAAHPLPSRDASTSTEASSSRVDASSTSSAGEGGAEVEAVGSSVDTYPRLPFELLLPIFQFAVLDEPLPTRYTTLRLLSLTSRLFRAEVQPLLFAVVKTTSLEQWERFVEAVKGRPDLGGRVRELRVEGWVGETRKGRDEAGEEKTARESTPSFPALTRALLPFSLFWSLATATPSSSSSSPFPHLRYLVFSLEDKPRRPSVRQALSLPSLRGIAAPLDGALCKFLVDPSLFPSSASSSPSLSPPPPQILYRTTWQHFVDFMPPWRSFPSASLGTIKQLHLLPLTYVPPPHYLSELIFRVQSDPALRELEVLYLPTFWDGIGTAEDREMWERVKGERGVEVVCEDAKDMLTARGGGLLEGFVRRCEARAGEGEP